MDRMIWAWAAALGFLLDWAWEIHSSFTIRCVSSAGSLDGWKRF